MRTIETIVTIGPDGRLVLQLPPDITPGQHKIVLVLEEQPVPPSIRPLLDFPVINVGQWPKGLSLKREDLYDDFGR